MRTVGETLRIRDRLDQRFAQLRGSTASSKERSLLELARIFEVSSTRYALIKGIAVQIWSAEPRTTLDVDIAVSSYDDLPRAAMVRAGFVAGQRFEHSENWTGPDGTPIQFSDDAGFAAAIASASSHAVGDVSLRVAPAVELIRSKLRSARDPARRRSKRLMDIADAAALAEQHPATVDSLDDRERRELGA